MEDYKATTRNGHRLKDFIILKQTHWIFAQTGCIHQMFSVTCVAMDSFLME